MANFRILVSLMKGTSETVRVCFLKTMAHLIILVSLMKGTIETVRVCFLKTMAHLIILVSLMKGTIETVRVCFLKTMAHLIILVSLMFHKGMRETEDVFVSQRVPVNTYRGIILFSIFQTSVLKVI